MNWKLLTLLTAFAVVLMLPSTALADACPGAGDDFCLQNNNVGLPPNAITVHIDLTAGQLTVTAHSDVFTDLDIKAVFMNNESGGDLLSGSPTCFCNGGTGGFGSFNSGALINTPGVQSTVSFNLGSNPTIVPNDNGANFSVHVAYKNQAGQNCSLWVSDGNQGASGPSSNLSFNKTRSTSLVRLSRLNATTQQTESDSGCGGTTEVPEPGSLALMGVGMFATVGYLRRRLNLG